MHPTQGETAAVDPTRGSGRSGSSAARLPEWDPGGFVQPQSKADGQIAFPTPKCLSEISSCCGCSVRVVFAEDYSAISPMC